LELLHKPPTERNRANTALTIDPEDKIAAAPTYLAGTIYYLEYNQQKGKRVNYRAYLVDRKSHSLTSILYIVI
jgi:hypothetical protein